MQHLTDPQSWDLYWLSGLGYSVLIFLSITGGLQLLRKQTQASPYTAPHWLLVWGSAAITTLLWHGTPVMAVFKASAGDSFYTLPMPERLGLLAWSAVLIGTFIFICQRKTQWIFQTGCRPATGFVADLLATLAIFTLLYGLSPQLYYFYYQQIIPGLPTQWVVHTPFELEQLFKPVLLRPTFNYADMLAGVTLWTCLFAVVLHHWLRATCEHGLSSQVLFGLGAAMGWWIWNGGL